MIIKMPAAVRSTKSIPKSQVMPPKLRLKLANECENLLSRAKLNPSIKKYSYYLCHSKQINKNTFAKLFVIFEHLMRDAYEKSSWGWNPEEKMAEWTHSRTRILIVTKCDISSPLDIISYGQNPDEDETIIGFMCLRFETGANKNECAIYVYELHIDVDYQRQGLGEELMRMARILGSEFRMDKIMLTVFRSNLVALQFYQKLKFSRDKSSPAENEADYSILSCKL